LGTQLGYYGYYVIMLYTVQPGRARSQSKVAKTMKFTYQTAQGLQFARVLNLKIRVEIFRPGKKKDNSPF
jgi:hypothetical protein